MPTQLRLAQVTGSFGTSGINDQIGAAATGSIATTDLQGVLSHLAGAIKRIHGQDSFSENTNTGEFATTLQPATDDGAALGGASNKWSDLYLADGAVVNFNNGNVTLTHSSNQILLGSGDSLAFGDAGENISGDGTDLAINSSNDILATATNIITLDAQGTTNGDGVEVFLGTDTSATKFSVKNNTGNEKFSVDGAGTATFANDVTITGDLTVNGTTTTIDTTTLLIEDSFIGLATGSADSDAPQGFVFNRLNSNLGNTGKTNGVFFFDGAASSGLPLYKLGATDLKGDSTAEAITDVPDSDLGELRIAVLSISGSNNLLSLNTANDELVLESDSGVDIKLNSQNNMVLDSAGTIFIDADTEIQLKDGGVQYGTISGSASGNDIGLHLKSFAASSNVFLNAVSGQMIFQHGSNAPGLTIDVADVGGVVDAIFKDVNDSEIFRLDASATSLLMATSNKIQFRDADASLASATAAGELIYSGSSSFIVANTTTSNSGLLKIQKDDKYVGFDFDGDTSVTYSWPNAPAENGYVLQAQTDGTLAWAAQGGAANSSKVSQSIGATVTAGAAASSDAGFSAVDTQAIADATAPNALDVFVNGQLLVSSSVAYASLASSSDGDYAISSAGVNNTDLKFTFDLEADDVVTVIVRA